MVAAAVAVAAVAVVAAAGKPGIGVTEKKVRAGHPGAGIEIN